MIVGSTFDRLLLFCRISTSVLSKEYLSFTSIISFLVFPSRTTKLGAVLYPLPKEVIPMDSNPVNGSILNVCGSLTVGLSVKSDE